MHTPSMDELLANKLADALTLDEHLLRWRLRKLSRLGHVARMSDNRLPKQLLFGELLTVRPSHGPRLRWRDVVLRDI